MISRLLHLVSIPGIFCIVFVANGCENNISDVNAVFDTRGDQVEKVFEVEMTYSDSAMDRVLIQAPEMHRLIEDRTPVQHFPNGIYVEFYDKFGNISSWLVADKADRYERSQRVIARRNVILYNIEQDTFRSEELIWDAQEEVVFTEGVFRFTSPDQDIIGYNFKSDPQFTNYSFYSMSGTTRMDVLEKPGKGE